MSSSPSSIARASSSSSIVATSAFGSHVLKIDGYTRTKGLATGIHLRSCSFHVGGHSWHLAYMPNGDSTQNADFISFYLVLEDAPANGTPVLAQFCIALLDCTGKPVPSHTHSCPMTRFAAHAAHRGINTFIRREVLETSRYLNVENDSFCVRCEVNVATGFRAEDVASDAAKAAAAACVRIPPPDLSRNFGELLRSELGADVRFRVDGKDFAAHRCVLMVRSPVFQAQLLSAMKEASLSAGEHYWMEIDDMRADVFRNLLHFIYTDALPTMPDESQEEALIMAQHLLVAADRYGMERLKLICEDVLCRHIDISSAANTLALAEQHRCQELKEACFQFLMKSPGSLNAVMATDGFDHLANSCPAIIKELISRLLISSEQD